MFHVNLWIYFSLLSSFTVFSISTSAFCCLYCCYCVLESRCALELMKVSVANHLNHYWTSFSSIGATSSLSCISSFQTWSLLIWQQIQQHTHFRNTYLLNMSSFYRPTSYTIQHCMFNYLLLSYKIWLLVPAIPSCHIEYQMFDATSSILVWFYR
jgi:hypothetical protein